MGVVHGGGWLIRSSHVALIYSPKTRIYFIHYASVGADEEVWAEPGEGGVRDVAARGVDPGGALGRDWP